VIKVETLRKTGIMDVERYEYDSMSRLTRQIRLVDEQDILNAGGMANLQNLRDTEYPDKLQVITGFEYDLLGNKVKEIQPKAYEFTEDDTASRNEHTIRYKYDDLNRLSGVIREYNGTEIAVRYWYDEEGYRTKTRNERGFETIYAYDEMNRLETSTDAMGNTYSYTYDLAGNKTSETNAKGYNMTYAYDNLNRLKTVTDPYNTVVTTNSYDANGNLTETKDAKGYATQYAYDLAGRVVKITDPEAALKNGFTESYEYSQYGEKTKITDGLGNTTSYSYDKAGRLEKVTDSLQITTQYTYDKAGNKLTMTDGRGKTTRYGYGAFGLLRTMTDADDRTMSYAYDLAGNTAGITDRNGTFSLFIYDNRNMLVEKLSANTGESIAYGYDAAGNRTAMQDESGSYTYAYDKNNRITEIRKGGFLQLTYTYDATGNIETVTDSKGHTTAYAYDKSGRMETVTFDGKTTTYAYEANGNRKSVIYEGGVKEEYSYDRNNRLLTLTNKKPNGTVLSQYSYTYDITGKETSKTDSYGKTGYTYDRAGRITRVEAPGKTTVYSYDNAGNRLSLLESYTSNQSSGFVDGDTGEAIEYMVKTSRYFYSNTNQLLKLAEEMSDSNAKVLLQKTTDYLYDENGNQLAETTSFLRPTGGTLKRAIRGSVHGESQSTVPDALMERTNNTFDGFNRLKAVEKIEDGIRTSVEYTYNGDDLRTRKVVKSSGNNHALETTNFLYDRQHVILETDATGTVKARYVRGINYTAQVNGTEDPSYFLFNGHGDTVQTVTPTGDIQNQYDYDIFGNPTLTIETAACSIRYAGEYLDNETGLYYLRARYYDPYTGRFISEDSYWGEDTNPLSLNLYTYAYNNPVRFIDPTGHNAERIDQLIGYIDASKTTWWAAQNNSNLTAAQKKAVQDYAHANAERFRAELAELERGNETVEQLVKQSGDDAGTWEGYKLAKVEEKIQNKSETIYEEQRNEARAMADRNWFQKTFGISNYDSQYDELDKVTLQELNKLYKLQAEYAMAVELGRNVFEKEIQLNEDEFKIKQKPGQIVKTDFDTRDIQLNVLNGVYFERFKKDIEYHVRQEYAVFDYYNYEHYKDNRYKMFGSTDEGTWADYLNQRGPVVDMSFISIAGTTWEEEGQAIIRAAELGIAMYMTMVMGADMLSMAGQTFNYYAAVFNSQGYYATMPTFDVTVSASGQAALAGSRTISISIPYVETYGLEAALSSTINFATFSDKFTAMMADGVGSGGGFDPFDKGGSNGELPSRNVALNQAKRDAGIPSSQQPEKVESVPMRAAPHEGGHVLKDANGNVIYTREYHYTNSRGQKIIIQEHSAGHMKGGQGPHFNVRPEENPRTGSVPGTQDHYPFE
jgi:RHS repeat-associated protein